MNTRLGFLVGKLTLFTNNRKPYVVIEAAAFGLSAQADDQGSDATLAEGLSDEQPSNIILMGTEPRCWIIFLGILVDIAS
jgi:hypothetical protein